MADEVFIEARANVLSLHYGERAVMPVDYPELAACLERGLVLLVGDDGTVPEPRPQPARSGCGGCGGH